MSALRIRSIRSPRFYEHTDAIISVQGQGDEVFVSMIDYQPIALEDVTDYIVRFGLEEPKNGTVEIAGPIKANMDDFVAKYIAITGKHIRVVSDDDSKYMHLVVPKSLLVPARIYCAGKAHFEDWALNTAVS